MNIEYRILSLLSLNFLCIIFIALVGGGFLHILGNEYSLINKRSPNINPQKIINLESKDSDEDTLYGDEVVIGLEIKTKRSSKIGRYIVKNLPKNNSSIIFSIIDKKTSMVISDSKEIQPGYAIYEIALNKEYPVGRHEVDILLKFYDLEQKEISEELRNILISVE